MNISTTFDGNMFKELVFCETFLMKKFDFLTNYNGNCNVKAEVIPDTKNMQKQTAYLNQSVDQLQLWCKEELVNFTEKGTRR